MAKIIENKLGLRVIKIGYGEMIALTGNVLPVCDGCLKDDVAQGYYIAVLNMWYCPKCYKEFLKRAKKYEEDVEIEEKNFNFYVSQLMKMNMLRG